MLRRFKVFLPRLAIALLLALEAPAAPFVIGIERDLHPITFVDANGKPAGFAIDLLGAIAAETGLEFRYAVLPRSEMFAEFAAQRLDGLANVVRTPERDATMAFAVTHLELRSTVFMRKGGPGVETPEDLRRVRVAGLANSHGHLFLRERGLDEHFIPLETMRDCLRALEDGRADVTIATRLFGRDIIQREKLDRVFASDLDLPELTYQFHIALRPEERLRLATINEGLARVRASGAYDQIYERWVGPLESRPLRFKDLQPYVPALVLLAVVIVAAFLRQRHLLRQNARQARELRESEERLRLVLEGSQDGFWDWDMRTGRIARSERWAAMLGYTLAEVAPFYEGGKTLIHPDDIASYETWLPRLVAGEDNYETEYRLRAKSGEWRWVLDRGKVVARDAAGKPLRMAGTHTDITERKNTEAALLESQKLLKRSAQLLQQTQSAARVGGWESDLRTGRVYWTPETFAIYETTPGDYFPTRESLYTFFTPESRERITAAVARAVQDGAGFTLELEITTAKRNRRHVQISGLPERENETTIKLFGSVRDITTEKVTEQEREKLRLKMLEAQKLESLGVLAGGIAHDFNNLLTVILANASFVRSDTGADDERIAHIENAARRAADLCRQMLAYAGKGSFVVERVDLGALMKDTADLIHVSISKKARLELELTPNLPPVEADASQLRQVVMNLVINASEALGDQAGTIRLTTRRGRPQAPANGVIHSFELPATDCVCLEISDTGLGMDSATLARIFDPFFTTKFAGRGLGLAAVLGIVRAHHGALTVESAPLQGSTFRLFLPAATPTAPASAKGPGPVPKTAAARGTILVADDESVLLATADLLLRREGYATVLAADGHEAVALYRADPQKFSAVVLDLTMPGLDGAEVLRILRTINPDVRALVMSGFSEQDVFARLRGLGQAAILRKPFSQETLLARVAEVLAL